MLLIDGKIEFSHKHSVHIEPMPCATRLQPYTAARAGY